MRYLEDLEDIKSLEYDWDGDEGSSFDPNLIEKAKYLAENISKLGTVRVYPVIGGNSIDLKLEGKKIYVNVCETIENCKDPYVYEVLFDLDKEFSGVAYDEDLIIDLVKWYEKHNL